MAIIAFIRVIAVALWIVLLLPIQMIFLLLRIKSGVILRCFHRGILVICGVRLERFGRLPSKPPVLYVVNHCSWMDIFVLGAVFRGSFIAKSDVRRWPIIGFLALLQNSLFIDRKAGKVRVQIDAMDQRLRQKQSLILFAEGTTSDGTTVLPFKSALFNPAWRQHVLVYPVSLVYTHIAGRRISRRKSSPIAWYGDRTLLPHIVRVFMFSRITARLEVHQPLDSRKFSHRKELAQHCHAVIADAFAAA